MDLRLNSSAILLADGSIWVFGENDKGQLGTGSSAPYEKNIVKMEDLDNVVKIAGGSKNFVAIDTAGYGYIWGDDDASQIANMEALSGGTSGMIKSLIYPIKLVQSFIILHLGQHVH